MLNFKLVTPNARATQFLNNLMVPSKKSLYIEILNKTLNLLRVQHNSNPLLILEKAVAKASPVIKLRGSKTSSKTVHFPIPLDEHKRSRMAIKWIIAAAEKRKGSLEKRLSDEISAILKGSSPALQSKLNLHKNALLNRSNVILTDRKIRKR